MGNYKNEQDQEMFDGYESKTDDEKIMMVEQYFKNHHDEVIEAMVDVFNSLYDRFKSSGAETPATPEAKAAEVAEATADEGREGAGQDKAAAEHDERQDEAVRQMSGNIESIKTGKTEESVESGGPTGAAAGSDAYASMKNFMVSVADKLAEDRNRKAEETGRDAHSSAELPEDILNQIEAATKNMQEAARINANACKQLSASVDGMDARLRNVEDAQREMNSTLGRKMADRTERANREARNTTTQALKDASVGVQREMRSNLEELMRINEDTFNKAVSKQVDKSKKELDSLSNVVFKKKFVYFSSCCICVMLLFILATVIWRMFVG